MFAFRHTLGLITVALSAISVFSAYESRATEVKTEQLRSASDWEAANTKFHDAYAAEKKYILAHLGPVIICGHGEVTLLNGTKRQTLPLQNAQHDHMKISDHEVLELYLLLRDNFGHALDNETLSKLSTLKHTLEETKETLNNSSLAGAAKENAVELLARSIVFVDAVLHDKSVTESELQTFTLSVGKESLESAYFAMKAYFGDLEKLVDELIEPLSIADRERLHVIVFGGHMAQKDNAEVQFFEKFLNQPGEGLKIVYCDEGNAEEAALDSLATHILDASIGKSFFGDPWRMHRDFRADAARRYLQEHAFTPLAK